LSVEGEGGVGADLGFVEARGLALGGPIVVEDAGFTQEKVGEGVEGVVIESLPIPVDIVIAQADGEGKDLVGGEVGLGEGVDEGEVVLGGCVWGEVHM